MQIFQQLFLKCFLIGNQIKRERFERKRFNKININETKIREVLSKLQTNKACGPDRIVNTVLKNLPALSKSPMLIFKTALKNATFLRIGK